MLTLSPRAFRRAADFITRELGIRMSPAKIPLLQSRLQRRIRVLGCASIDEYIETVLGSAAAEGELQEFMDAVTTNKTDFFREPAHFDFLTTRALPALDPDPARPWSARVWSAGCSSGQEVYTLAMVLSEYGTLRPGFTFRVVGTDISRRVLTEAEMAIYAAAVVEPVAPALRRKYLLRSRDAADLRVRVVPELRARVEFRRLNFMDDSYGLTELFDAIFFRNVMIYFDKPTQQQVVNKLCAQLRPGGYLFIGHSESLAGLDLPLESLGSAVYRKR